MGSFQSSSVLTTMAASESNLNVNLSFCTQHNILDRLLKRVASDSIASSSPVVSDDSVAWSALVAESNPAVSSSPSVLSNYLVSGDPVASINVLAASSSPVA